jgi:hypothetical protein
MSDLIEKVARAICQTDSDPDELIGGKPMWTGWQDEARAAIAAVAEWLEDGAHGLTDGELYLAARIRKQLEQPK